MTRRFKRPVTIATVSGASVIELHGEFDLSNVAPVALHLDAAIRAGAGSVIVDLSDARFVNSTLVNALFQACRQIHQTGGKLALVTGDAQARKVIELTALDQAAGVYGAVEDAVAGAAER